MHLIINIIYGDAGTDVTDTWLFGVEKLCFSLANICIQWKFNSPYPTRSIEDKTRHYFFYFFLTTLLINVL